MSDPSGASSFRALFRSVCGVADIGDGVGAGAGVRRTGEGDIALLSPVVAAGEA